MRTNVRVLNSDPGVRNDLFFLIESQTRCVCQFCKQHVDCFIEARVFRTKNNERRVRFSYYNISSHLRVKKNLIYFRQRFIQLHLRLVKIIRAHSEILFAFHAFVRWLNNPN